MDNTTPEIRVQVAQKLRRLADVVAELEEAGVRVIKAEGTITRMDNVLLSLHEPGSLDAFRGWLEKKGLDYAMDYRPGIDPRLTLCWDLTTIYNGVELQGFLSDEDAELWREAEAAE